MGETFADGYTFLHMESMVLLQARRVVVVFDGWPEEYHGGARRLVDPALAVGF